MGGKVEICGVNTAKLKVLKNDETDALLLRVKNKDMKAREELIQGNLRLVLSVIQKFMNRGENADDLFQVGCIGLIKAIDNFDTSLGVRFSTYGVPMNVRSRKQKGLHTMTRKQGLEKAIEVLKTLGDSELCKAIEALELCLRELPFAQWSKTAIFDACDQFILEHGHITVNDFNKKELPSHPTIKNRFGLTAGEFRDKYYPLSRIGNARSPYRNRTPAEWKDVFIEEYNRLQPSSQRDFNRRRGKDVPTWITIARMHGETRWTGMMALCGLLPATLDKSRHVENEYSIASNSVSGINLAILDNSNTNLQRKSKSKRI